MHPLATVRPAKVEGEGPFLEPIVLPPTTMQSAPPDLAVEGSLEAVAFTRKKMPLVVQRLFSIAMTSPNHNAGRGACRDLAQIAGVLTETSRVDVVVSFRALFAKMNADELQAFLKEKIFPERFRDEAMKLISHVS